MLILLSCIKLDKNKAQAITLMQGYSEILLSYLLKVSSLKGSGYIDNEYF